LMTQKNVFSQVLFKNAKNVIYYEIPIKTFIVVFS